MSSSFSAALFLVLLSSDDFCTKHLDRVLAWHCEYGLSLPPEDAVLVICRERGHSYLAFTLDGITPWSDPKWKFASTQCVSSNPERLRDVDYIDWLELALVSHKRGWKALARVAIREWTAKRLWDAEESIGRGALRYWEQQITEAPETPLPVIAKYLNRVQKFGREGSKSRDLLRSVELAIKPCNSPPGSDDALIDQLLGVTGWYGEDGVTGFRYDQRYRAIVRRGFDAVPALIAHLADDRITRAQDRCAGNPLRVKDVVYDILVQLNGEWFDLNIETLDDRLKAVGNWFADAHKLGEEKYVVSRIIGDKGDGFRETLLWLLAEKYPRRLPEVFRKVIDNRPSQHNAARHYAKAIAEAPLPVADKLKVLEYAATHKSTEVSAAGIRYLRPFNPKFAKEQLLHCLTEKQTKERDERLLAEIVAESTDADEWKALAITVRQANAVWRIQLLDVISEVKAPEGRKQRLAFLAEYLTDDERRVDNNAYAGFPWLEVRNFAAMRLAEVLKIDAEPERDWTAAQWAELRAQVKARVQEELCR